MGHLTFVGLRRETLSLFHCVYQFARKFYHRREPLWISARAELEAFVGVLILMELYWARPWLSGVLASEASLSCYGVAQSFWNPSDVATVCRDPEVRRWRCGAVLSRRHAFERAGFRVDSRSGEFLRDCFGRPISLDPELAAIIASDGRQIQAFQRCRLVCSRVTDVTPGPWSKQPERSAHSWPVHDCGML